MRVPALCFGPVSISDHHCVYFLSIFRRKNTKLLSKDTRTFTWRAWCSHLFVSRLQFFNFFKNLPFLGFQNILTQFPVVSKKNHVWRFLKYYTPTIFMFKLKRQIHHPPSKPPVVFALFHSQCDDCRGKGKRRSLLGVAGALSPIPPRVITITLVSPHHCWEFSSTLGVTRLC